jgi:hypothetical protein
LIIILNRIKYIKIMFSNKVCEECGNIHEGESCAANTTSFVWKGQVSSKAFITGSWNSW